MAYTYSDAIKKVKDAGLYDETSGYDKGLLVSNPDFADSIIRNKTGYKNAAADEERARYNDLLNADRARLGSYTGGRTGMEYNPTGNVQGGGVQSSFSGTKSTAKTGSTAGTAGYNTPYAAAIRGYLTPSSVRDFSYNYKKDPTYQALYAAALKNGELSGKNTLARAAAMTGGAPSTYAVQAAAAAENQALNDVAYKIPELESAAYQRFADTRDFYENRRMNMLNAYLNLDGTAYGRHRDDISDRRYEDETAYSRNRDEKQWEYTARADKRSRELEDAALAAELSGDYTRYAALLGIPVENINRYQAKLASQAAKSRSSGSGSGKSKAAGGAVIGSEEWRKNLYDKYGSDAKNKILYEYKDLGISSKDAAEGLADEFEQWAQEELSAKESAKSNMMTKTEWARHKNSGSDYWGSEADTYDEYVKAYREYYGV